MNKYAEFSRTPHFPQRIPLLLSTPREEVHQEELVELAIFHENYRVPKGSQRGCRAQKRSIGGGCCGL